MLQTKTQPTSIISLEKYINDRVNFGIKSDNAKITFSENYETINFKNKNIATPRDFKTSAPYMRAVIEKYQTVFTNTWNPEQKEVIADNGGHSVGYRGPKNYGGLNPLIGKENLSKLTNQNLIDLAGELQESMNLDYRAINKSASEIVSNAIAPIFPSYQSYLSLPKVLLLSSPALSEIAVRFALSASTKLAQGYLGVVQKTYGDDTIFGHTEEKLAEFNDKILANGFYFPSAVVPKNFFSFAKSSITSLISLPEIGLRIATSSVVLAATLPILVTSKIAKIGEAKSSNPSARQNILEKSISHLAAYQQTLLAPRLNTPKYFKNLWEDGKFLYEHPGDAIKSSSSSLGYSLAGAVAISIATPVILTETAIRTGLLAIERVASTALWGMGKLVGSDSFKNSKKNLARFQEKILEKRLYVDFFSSPDKAPKVPVAIDKKISTPQESQLLQLLRKQILSRFGNYFSSPKIVEESQLQAPGIEHPAIAADATKFLLEASLRTERNALRNASLKEELKSFNNNLEIYVNLIKNHNLLGEFLDSKSLSKKKKQKLLVKLIMLKR